MPNPVEGPLEVYEDMVEVLLVTSYPLFIAVSLAILCLPLDHWQTFFFCAAGSFWGEVRTGLIYGEQAKIRKVKNTDV